MSDSGDHGDGGHSRARAGLPSEVDEGIADALDFAAFPADREARVQFVMGLMTNMQWETGKTGKRIAAVAGVSEDTMKRIAAEASRRLRCTIDKDAVRHTLASTLREAMAEGIRLCRPHEVVTMKGDVIEGPGDARALSGLAAIAKTYAALVGADAPTRLEHTGADGAPLGLPAALAALKPAPTLAELEEYARTGMLPERAQKPN